MLSLPNIFQGSGQLPKSASVVSESDNSTFFCNVCTHDLALPVQQINRRVLKQYEEKYAQIRNMQRLLHEEETSLLVNRLPQSLDVHRTSIFQISRNSKETLQIYAFGFPLISKSGLIAPEAEEFNWEHLKNKILKRQSRCNILHKTPQFGRENKLHISRHGRYKVRRLPSLETNTLERGKHYGFPIPDVSPPPKILSANPEVVVFENFEVGTCYEKRCKITNVSRGKCKFKIIPFDNTSQFKVLYDKSGNTLPAGLSFWITIRFVCSSLADIEENLVIRSNNGKDLIVLIKAESDPPFLIEANDTACNMFDVVDSLVDCGSHFVGEESQTALTLKNIGASSRFCFVAESDWVNLEFSIDNSNTLEADHFKIHPMYFGLKKGQEITICVTSTPPSNGLHTTRVLLLCENGTLNNVDLVCDGWLFEPSLIDHLNMQKTFDVDKEDMEFVECYLDFGEMLTFDIRYTCFFMFNTADVSMTYHWELRRVTVAGTEPLPPVAISVLPRQGSLAPRLAEMFCLKVNTQCVPPGVYRTLLVLVVDELPKKCVPIEYCKRLIPLNEEDPDELRSIEAKYIEVWVECVSPKISLNPYVIDFLDFPIEIGSEIEKREIIVKNDSPGVLTLTWECFDESSTVRARIDPSSIICDVYSTFTCTLSVEAVEEGPFQLSFWCISRKEDAKVELLVNGRCYKPRLTALTDSIDFGIVKIGSCVDSAIVAKNCSSSDSFQWYLDELYFRSSDEGLTAFTEASTALSTNCGEICHRNSEILVNYQLECQEDTLWCSVLEWDGNYIPVTIDIQAPDISLNTYTLSADPIYLNVVCHMRVTVTNHSFIEAAVFWGCPTDQNLEVVSVEVEPRCFVLQPEGQMVVEIKVTPYQTGQLENLYIPCFAEGKLQPLLLKIEGNVEGLNVRVEWDSKDQHCCVFWPTPKRDLEEETDESFNRSVCQCPPNSLQESGTLLNSSEDVTCDIVTLHSGSGITLNNANEEALVIISHQDSQYYVCNKDNTDEEDNTSVASSIPYHNWPIIGGRYTRYSMAEEWEDHFNNLFILEELSRENNNAQLVNYPERNALYFHDIPVREAVSQTLYIRNDTAIPTSYEVSVVYNFERVSKPDGLPDAETVLRKMKDQYDEYVERATPHRGLTVFVTPESGELPAHDYVTLTVTVVALSWGDYSDLIVLQVGDLNHLCVKLNVSVNQPPVVAPQRVVFGSLTLQNPPVSRFFKVQNISTVPVYVCWDIFTPTPDILPFSVALFDSDPFELKLIDYYGANASPYFNVREKYTDLEPGSSKMIEVHFNPLEVKLDKDNKEFDRIIKAELLGHIYIAEGAKVMSISENCSRNEGSTHHPLKVDLEVHVEIPLLTLLNVFNYQLVFKCTANDIMKTSKKVWSSESTVTVKNDSRTNLEAKVHTFGYFYVKQIDYPCSHENSRNSKRRLSLRPGEYCEVTIVCQVSETELLDCFEPDSEGMDEESIGICSVEKGMLSFEQEGARQEVQLELWMYPPLLQFSELCLDFGKVFIEDTKMLIVNITAPVNEEYFEAFIKNGTNSPFYINTNSGMLKPKTGYLLQVFFSPKVCSFYQDTLIVRSCLVKLAREIPLTGIGTFDYRDHTY